jgi:hypothetical protein
MSGAMIGGGAGLDPEGFGASAAAFVGCGVKLLPPFITLDFSSMEEPSRSPLVKVAVCWESSVTPKCL